jgi:UDP-glucose 4-epimerase
LNILVTGGAGFIGSHLVELLLQLGHKVTVIDDLSTGKRSFLKNVETHSNFSFIEGNVNEHSLILYIVKKNFDVIFHLSAVLGVKNTVENPLKVIEGNIEGTKNILEAAYQYQTKVVFASTSEVYGKNESTPFHEDSNRVLGPTTTHRWCYATAKALDEHLCFAYAKKGLPVTVIRYFNSYGPRAIGTQYGGVIPKFITAALNNEPITIYGNGEQTRCFTYISDVISGTISCLLPISNNEVFNIGMEQQLSINTLASKIKSFTNSMSPIVYIPYKQAYGEGYEDMQDRIPDITKARRLLNYNPVVNIDDGLIKTIEWYKQLGSEQS